MTTKTGTAKPPVPTMVPVRTGRGSSSGECIAHHRPTVERFIYWRRSERSR